MWSMLLYILLAILFYGSNGNSTILKPYPRLGQPHGFGSGPSTVYLISEIIFENLNTTTLPSDCILQFRPTKRCSTCNATSPPATIIRKEGPLGLMTARGFLNNVSTRQTFVLGLVCSDKEIIRSEQSVVIQPTTCGNGLVEVGEECDNGEITCQGCKIVRETVKVVTDAIPTYDDDSPPARPLDIPHCPEQDQQSATIYHLQFDAPDTSSNTTSDGFPLPTLPLDCIQCDIANLSTSHPLVDSEEQTLAGCIAFMMVFVGMGGYAMAHVQSKRFKQALSLENARLISELKDNLTKTNEQLKDVTEKRNKARGRCGQLEGEIQDIVEFQMKHEEKWTQEREEMRQKEKEWLQEKKRMIFKLTELTEETHRMENEGAVVAAELERHVAMLFNLRYYMTKILAELQDTHDVGVRVHGQSIVDDSRLVELMDSLNRLLNDGSLPDEEDCEWLCSPHTPSTPQHADSLPYNTSIDTPSVYTTAQGPAVRFRNTPTSISGSRSGRTGQFNRDTGSDVTPTRVNKGPTLRSTSLSNGNGTRGEPNLRGPRSASASNSPRVTNATNAHTTDTRPTSQILFNEPSPPCLNLSDFSSSMTLEDEILPVPIPRPHPLKFRDHMRILTQGVAYAGDDSPDSAMDAKAPALSPKPVHSSATSLTHHQSLPNMSKSKVSPSPIKKNVVSPKKTIPRTLLPMEKRALVPTKIAQRHMKCTNSTTSPALTPSPSLGKPIGATTTNEKLKTTSPKRLERPIEGSSSNGNTVPTPAINLEQAFGDIAPMEKTATNTITDPANHTAIPLSPSSLTPIPESSNPSGTTQ